MAEPAPPPTPPPTVATEFPAERDWCDQLLALVMSDGPAAVAAADAVLARPGLPPGEQALAHAACALVALRAGDDATAERRRAIARRLLDDGPACQRASDLLAQVHALRCRREGRLDEAEAALRVLHARAAQRPQADACLCAGSLGIVLSMRGADMDALDHFYQALSLARHTGADALVVNALNNLGSYQADLYNLEDAVVLLEECVAGAQRLGSHHQVIFAAGNLVQCLCLMGQAERALAVAREFLIDTIRPDDPPWLQRDEEIAQALLDNGLIDEAAARLQTPAPVDHLTNDMATMRAWLDARVLLARDQPAQALARCLARRDAVAQQGESTLPVDRMNLWRVAALAAQRTGDHALACQLLHEAFAMHETLLGRAARSRQLSLKITHRLAQAEWERDAARQTAARMEALNHSLQAQIAETQRLQWLLQAQANEDPLTGLYNRRHLMDAGATLLSRHTRRDDTVALAIIDLDHFKGVNDRHGHETGDRVLQGFAEMAQPMVRPSDLLCRLGGEEFVLLMPATTAHEAAQRVRELLGRFSQRVFVDAQGRSLQCSFSAGVADSHGATTTVAALLARADAALYAAKHAGRGCVHCAVPLARGE